MTFHLFGVAFLAGRSARVMRRLTNFRCRLSTSHFPTEFFVEWVAVQGKPQPFLRLAPTMCVCVPCLTRYFHSLILFPSDGAFKFVRSKTPRRTHNDFRNFQRFMTDGQESSALGVIKQLLLVTNINTCSPEFDWLVFFIPFPLLTRRPVFLPTVSLVTDVDQWPL